MVLLNLNSSDQRFFYNLSPNVESDNSRGQKQQQRRPPGPNLNASRGARGGRGGRGGQSNLIQSHSIFEAGSAESTKRCTILSLILPYNKTRGTKKICLFKKN